MPSLPPLPLAAAAGAAAAAALAGCGEPAPVAVDAAPLRLTLSEYRVEPQAVRVPAGRVEIVVRNGGATVHRLQLRSGDRTRTLATSPPLRPGQTARLVVELAPGRYVDACAVERHDTLGEHGTIVAR
ncbi:MAG: cupredoxin domain-containing protein [Actinobacteria bacterium]|nr:cupredoxin domain-containing protein [Actinomycetota bacterium]